ncbi:MAG: pyridoxine 5'-phosphate synthase [Proteobacteria bacterium]|nr:pyridoxine 5'-phosphate synthase [Pseudomonadota bacterium]
MTRYLRLGINVDHVATLRNARGGAHPDPVAAARAAVAAGADGIVAHLREDRRHIRDADIRSLRQQIAKPLNFEMAATAEMLAIALDVRPHACCLVPERRTELTTEGGLDVAKHEAEFAPFIRRLTAGGIRVSLFIDPEPAQLDAAARVQAPAIELHTGTYCEAKGAAQQGELRRIAAAAAHAERLGLECHAGHGLNFDNVGPIAAIATIVELNIGHFLIGHAVFDGLGPTIARMRSMMDQNRR